MPVALTAGIRKGLSIGLALAHGNSTHLFAGMLLRDWQSSSSDVVLVPRRQNPIS